MKAMAASHQAIVRCAQALLDLNEALNGRTPGSLRVDQLCGCKGKPDVAQLSQLPSQVP